MIIQKWNGGIPNFKFNDNKIIILIIRLFKFIKFIEIDNNKIDDEYIWVKR